MNINSYKKIILVYDKECPVCQYYSNTVRIQESLGDLELINARDNSSIREELTALGFDLDQGMVLKLDNQVYYGPDAIHMLALIGSPSSLMNRVNYIIFRSKKRSHILYPLLKTCRNSLLALLGKKKIANLKVK